MMIFEHGLEFLICLCFRAKSLTSVIVLYKNPELLSIEIACLFEFMFMYDFILINGVWRFYDDHACIV